MFVAWTSMLAVTGPTGNFGEVTSTPSRCRLMSWVRNGNPSTDTSGLTGKPSAWSLVAIRSAV